jgi:hypothetical protein
MKFLLAQTLFQKMGGGLTLFSIPKPNSTEMITRIEGELRLIIPAELAENLATDCE